LKTAVVLGTRPEIIKMSPIIRELEDRKDDYFIVHTGQHYSYNLDKVFFDQLELPNAKYNLEVGSGSDAEQTSRILALIEKVFMQEKPAVVLVQGDTNTVLGAALAAAKLNSKVGHVEAGLRSYDRQMPEEINRVLTDHCSEYLFAPTEKTKMILMGEGISESKIFITGNTIVDAIYQNLDRPSSGADILQNFNLRGKDYFLVTIHRQENVDNPARFGSILQGLALLASKHHLPIVYPMHPRSRKMMNKFNLTPQNLMLTEPVDFFGFLQLEKHAKLILTDSGGVQEESCILGIPCVTLRDNTERPETLDVGANILSGTLPGDILKCSEIMLNKLAGWSNPFGDGNAGKRIIEIIHA
jgi:UDP-N-acetylglucosamine 2-epimerase (non-hydrolysing)